MVVKLESSKGEKRKMQNSLSPEKIKIGGKLKTIKGREEKNAK